MRRAARPLYLDLEGREKKKCCANSKLDLFESDAEGKTVSRRRIRGFLIDSAKKTHCRFCFLDGASSFLASHDGTFPSGLYVPFSLGAEAISEVLIFFFFHFHFSEKEREIRGSAAKMMGLIRPFFLRGSP